MRYFLYIVASKRRLSDDKSVSKVSLFAQSSTSQDRVVICYLLLRARDHNGEIKCEFELRIAPGVSPSCVHFKYPKSSDIDNAQFKVLLMVLARTYAFIRILHAVEGPKAFISTSRMC